MDVYINFQWTCITFFIFTINTQAVNFICLYCLSKITVKNNVLTVWKTQGIKNYVTLKSKEKMLTFHK